VVSWLYIALLALAVAVVVGAEWPRLESRLGARFGADARRRRERAKRKATLHVVPSDADDFAASVERDLAQLPTIEETDRRN
jgi:arginase family enzyme